MRSPAAEGRLSNEYVRTGIAAKMMGIHKDTVRKLYHEKLLTGYHLLTNAKKGTYRIMISVKSIETLKEKASTK